MHFGNPVNSSAVHWTDSFLLDFKIRVLYYFSTTKEITNNKQFKDTLDIPELVPIDEWTFV